MSKPFSGIVQQLQYEQAAAAKASIDWRAKVFVPADFPLSGSLFERSIFKARHFPKFWIGRPIGWVLFRLDYLRALVRECRSGRTLVIRYAPGDPFLLLFSLANRGRYYLVHHTIEESQIAASMKIRDKLLLLMEKLCSAPILNRARGLIAVTDEILRYEQGRSRRRGQPGFIYPNGVLFSENRHLPDNRQRVVTALFMASKFEPWQGLDLLIQSVLASNIRMNLDVVGEVSEADRVQGSVDSRIKFHGTLSRGEYMRLLASSDVCISSLALERKGLTAACPLKVREYLQFGVPVYAGHEDVFPSSFSHFRIGPVDAGLIQEFAMEQRIYARSEIQCAAAQFVDKSKLLLQLYNWIADSINRNP